jgi:hypothetical protein
MTTQRCLLGAYRVLLQLYPPAFRRRFAAEMLELAEAAELGEWPVIFGDTSLGIVRCWLEGERVTSAVAEPNAYISLGVSTVWRWGLLRGFCFIERDPDWLVLLQRLDRLPGMSGTDECECAPNSRAVVEACRASLDGQPRAAVPTSTHEHLGKLQLCYFRRECTSFSVSACKMRRI